MNRLRGLCGVCLLFACLDAWPDPRIEVRDWFERDYAPLWRDAESFDPDRVASFFASSYIDSTDNPTKVIRDPVKAWDAYKRRWIDWGWKGSEPSKMKVELINAATAVIRMRWKLRLENGWDHSYSCDLYIAGKFADGWKFTNYAYADCEGGPL